MLMSLLLAAALAEEPAPAKFILDKGFGPEAKPMPRYRALPLGDKPARPLEGGPKAGPGVHYSLVRIGREPELTCGVVWQSKSQEIWFDNDGDGKLAPEERRPFTEKTIEMGALIRIGNAGRARAITFKRGAGTSLYISVQGYTRGRLRLAGKEYNAALTDGDADGCFDSVGSDRLLIDLNSDSSFDPVAEQFPLGTPISVENRLYLVQPDPTGTTVQVRERGAETGRLRVSLPLADGAQLKEFEANLVSEFGESVVVNSTEPATLPIGKYRVEALTVQAADDKGRLWKFRFCGYRQFGVKVEAGKESLADLLDGIAFTTGVKAESVAAGGQVMVSPMWQTPTGVYLTECDVNGSPGGATIALVDSGGNALDRSSSGFL